MHRNSTSITRIWHTFLGVFLRVPIQSRTRGGPLKREVCGFSHAHLTGFKLPGE